MEIEMKIKYNYKIEYKNKHKSKNINRITANQRKTTTKIKVYCEIKT